jgi:hypothetical protein
MKFVHVRQINLKMHTEPRICKCLSRPGIESKDSISRAYVPGRRATWARGIDYLESIPWLITRLQIRTQVAIGGRYCGTESKKMDSADKNLQTGFDNYYNESNQQQ